MKKKKILFKVQRKNKFCEYERKRNEKTNKNFAQ